MPPEALLLLQVWKFLQGKSCLLTALLSTQFMLSGMILPWTLHCESSDL